MDDDERARFDYLLTTWRASAADAIGLLRDLHSAQWSTPSELDGWTVHDLAAHLTHLESFAAGFAQPGFEQASAQIPDEPRLATRSAKFIEAGVIARRASSPAEMVDELERAVAARDEYLQANPPTSLADRGDGVAKLTGWTWDTLLSNRSVDLWMHEQDIRRVVDRPGNLESAGARHTRDLMSSALAYIVARRVKAPEGTTVLWTATGPGAVTIAVSMDADGRCRPVPPASVPNPSVQVTLSFQEWLRRSGGRGADAALVEVSGDQSLGQAILDHLIITP